MELVNYGEYLTKCRRKCFLTSGSVNSFGTIPFVPAALRN
jgi:hypothetical protein